jgi:c-di-GMP-binding flagellar brake protein YcgR
MGWFRRLFNSAPSAPIPQEVDTAVPSANSERRRVTNFLRLMGAHAQKALVSSSQLGTSWQAAFLRTDHSEVLLRLQSSDFEALLDPGDFCTVTFSHEDQAHVFLTTVKESALGEDGQVEATLYLPDAIHSAGRRNLYRVPILQDLPMKAQIIGHSGDESLARPRDINTSGARLKLDAANLDQFSIGEEVQITLELQDIRVTHKADIRHVDKNSHTLGVHFLNTEDPLVTQNIRLLVREAERCYLRRVNRLE